MQKVTDTRHINGLSAILALDEHGASKKVRDDRRLRVGVRNNNVALERFVSTEKVCLKRTAGQQRSQA